MASIFRGIGKAVSAPIRIKRAKERYEVALTVYQQKFAHYEAYTSETEKQLEELGRMRTGGMRTIIEAIEFLQQFKTSRLKNPHLVGDDNAQLEEMEKLERFYGNILKSVGAGTGVSAAGGAGIGAMAAFGAYGLAGAIGVASTGTAISSLSGAAATSATLAWLGGGALAVGGAGILGGMAVLGGIVAAPVLVATGIFLKKKADDVERDVERELSKIQNAEVQIEKALTQQKIARQRADELGHTISALIEELKAAMRKAEAEPNLFQRAYRKLRQFVRILTRRPRVGPNDAAIYQIMQIAKALRDTIDEPVIRQQH